MAGGLDVLQNPAVSAGSSFPPLHISFGYLCLYGGDCFRLQDEMGRLRTARLLLEGSALQKWPGTQLCGRVPSSTAVLVSISLWFTNPTHLLNIPICWRLGAKGISCCQRQGGFGSSIMTTYLCMTRTAFICKTQWALSLLCLRHLGNLFCCVQLHSPILEACSREK